MDPEDWAALSATEKEQVATIFGLAPDAGLDRIQASLEQVPGFNGDTWSALQEQMPVFCEPNAQVDAQWAVRLRDGGFSSQQFPPWAVASEFGTIILALQLLFILDPEEAVNVSECESSDSELALDTNSRIVKDFRQSSTRLAHLGAMHTAWFAMIHDNELFGGHFGILVNNNAFTSREGRRDEHGTIWTVEIQEDVVDWQSFFRLAFGPIDLRGEPAGYTSSLQIFVVGALPAYLSVRFDQDSASPCDLFPRADSMLPMRREDGFSVLMRVRWAGGLYCVKVDDEWALVLVFDWGDGEGCVGVSFSGDWATDPPLKKNRATIERGLKRSGFKPLLMLFRRV
ncbi:hypothetical protein IWX90DRAFT_415455 [Phyllosticta citrichinensis]|uniref:Uncharacterized protein n=1 Tax=Phyllosticta citrichinensis TaxID=1130410 RepID=A0ABR1XV86_9PEZI